MANRYFKLVHAQHAVREDGIHVEFMGRSELAYGTAQRSIVLTVETYIADDGAPDGVIVHRDDDPRWSDGTALTDQEFDGIMTDLHDAEAVLLTRFRLPTEAS